MSNALPILLDYLPALVGAVGIAVCAGALAGWAFDKARSLTQRPRR